MKYYNQYKMNSYTLQSYAGNAELVFIYPESFSSFKKYKTIVYFHGLYFGPINGYLSYLQSLVNLHNCLAILVDSYSLRNLRNTVNYCPNISNVFRPYDVIYSLTFTKQLRFVDTNNIHVIGDSGGGKAIMEAISTKHTLKYLKFHNQTFWKNIKYHLVCPNCSLKLNSYILGWPTNEDYIVNIYASKNDKMHNIKYIKKTIDKIKDSNVNNTITLYEFETGGHMFNDDINAYNIFFETLNKNIIDK